MKVLLRTLRFFPSGIVIILIVFAIRWLFLPGYLPTHDGEYHIIRFHELETMLKNGYLFPRWAPGLNSGYGIPLFNFFYPLPNYVGVFFHFFGASLSDAFKLTLAVGYLVSCFFCYQWLKRLFGSQKAFIGVLIFAYIPYWFVDIFVRGSVGEVLAIAMLMGCLYSVESTKSLFLSLFVAGIVLSHNILAMLFLPLVFIYVLMRKCHMLPQIFLGIAIASYFWIPALVERPLVTGLNTVDFRDHFPELAQLLVPSWGTGFSDRGLPANEMSFQIGAVPFMVILGSGYFLAKEKNRALQRLGRFFFTITLLSFFFLLSSSQWVWERISIIQLLQYPWRLLSLFLPVVAFASGYIAFRIQHRWIIFVIASFGVVAALPYTKPVVYIPRDDTYYLSRREFTDGTSSLGNSFSTIWSPWKKERAATLLDIIQGHVDTTPLVEKSLHFRNKILAAEDSKVRFNIVYYPGWTVLIDNKSQAIQYESDGLITVFVPQGNHVVDIRFRETSVRLLADGISIASFFWVFRSGILKLLYACRNRYIRAKQRS